MCMDSCQQRCFDASSNCHDWFFYVPPAFVVLAFVENSLAGYALFSNLIELESGIQSF